MKRREFIQYAATTTALVSYSPFSFGQGESILDLSPSEIELMASPQSVSLLPGDPTAMWTFTGQVKQGGANTLSMSSGFLGPKIEVRKGQRLKVNFQNQLPEDSIVHWHGLHLDTANDGHPTLAVGSGESYQYDFVVNNRAGLYWYHPHPHGRTGHQVYQGLAGLFVVRDDEEDQLNLPSGENELFLVFQDREFDANNQLVYIQSGHDIMMGKVGNNLLVNGGFDFQRKVKSEAYRLRILNGSNALSYRLAWDDQRPLTIIGTDGGLLEAPLERASLLLAPGERLDLIVDLSNMGLGEKLQLQSIPLVDGNGEAFVLYELEVSEKGTQSFTLPSKLSLYENIPLAEAVNAGTPKSFVLMPKQGVGWTIDDLTYEMHKVRDKERVALGTTEVWEFDLTNAGMIHPMHIHGAQFQVVERIHGPFSKDLVLDQGWKDTVAVLPGDKVRVIKRFQDYKGLFLFHCHILEHEDHSMMRNYEVY